MEVGDNRYTRMGTSVIRSDVVDIDSTNKLANIHSDLRDLKNIADNTYDTIILTHVLGMIDDYPRAIEECFRVLKPSGALLFTGSCFSPTHDVSRNYWRFTVSGAMYAFGKTFGKTNVRAKSFGNVLSGQYFWVGLAKEELSLEELDYKDPNYPCIIGLVAMKRI